MNKGPTYTVSTSAIGAAMETSRELSEFVEQAGVPVVIFFAFDAGVPEGEREVVVTGNMEPETALSVATQNWKRIQLAVEEARNVQKS